MRSCSSRVVIAFVAIVLGFGAVASAADAPAGTMTWGVHITLASRWLDPGETEGVATPFMGVYALHDALVKPMPTRLYTPRPPAAFTQANGGLTDECGLRQGGKVHN